MYTHTAHTAHARKTIMHGLTKRYQGVDIRIVSNLITLLRTIESSEDIIEYHPTATSAAYLKEYMTEYLTKLNPDRYILLVNIIARPSGINLQSPQTADERHLFINSLLHCIEVNAALATHISNGIVRYLELFRRNVTIPGLIVDGGNSSNASDFSQHMRDIMSMTMLVRRHDYLQLLNVVARISLIN